MGTDKWCYFIAHIYLLIVLCGYMFGMPILFFVVFIGFYSILTILDLFIKRDSSVSYEEVLVVPENDGRLSPWIYQIETCSFLVFYLVVLGLGMYFVQFKQPSLTWGLYVIPIGICNMIIISICHEYMHKNTRIEKFIARVFLSLTFFSQFELDHLYNHHNSDVTCTDKDPGLARLNQSVYSYTYQFLSKNLTTSIEIQKKMLNEKGYSFYNLSKNGILKWNLISVLISLLVLFFVGLKALLFLIGVAFIGLFVFGSASYNQHYGLTRRIRSDGSLEPFTFMNIWASEHFFEDHCYVNGTHHGHHHLFNLCRYPYLKIIKLSPVLPYGYNIMLLISFFPKAWFKLMNPLVAKVFELRDQYEKEGKL